MKKLLSVVFAVSVVSSSFAQTTDSTQTTVTPRITQLPQTTPPKKDWSKVTIDQAGDHFMIQLSSDNWSGATDSIKSRKGGFSRGLNIAVMLNKPFKTDPHWSVAFGLGISHSSILFKNTSIDLTSTSTELVFQNVQNTDHFKKYKLATTFLEAPIELRYTFDPENQKKSKKLALGVKVGTMLNTHTKGKTLQNSSNATIDSYTLKESKRTYFNSTRLAATARVGLGNFAIFGAYSITTLLKDVAGPSIRPYQLGIAITGL